MKKLILLLCALLSTVGGVVWAQGGPTTLPADPGFVPGRVLTATGFYGEKTGVHGDGGMSTTVISERTVYHAAEPTADSRIEMGITGLAAKKMEKLHIAVWAKEDVTGATIEVYSGGWKTVSKDLTGGTWNVFNLAFDDFSEKLVDASAIKLTKGGSELGTEIYITDVFFYNEGAKPLLIASFDSFTSTSVSFKLKSIKSTSATEDGITYTITWDDGGEKVITKDNGDEFVQEITGLTTGKPYNFSITAKDAADVVSAPEIIKVTPVAEPTDVPTPTKNSEDVFAVYTQLYSDAPGLVNSGDWTSTDKVVNSKKTKKVENLVWCQFAFTTKDVSEMQTVHFDIYPMRNMPQIGIRVQGVEVDSHYRKELTAGEWNSFDIDLRTELGLTDEKLKKINNIQIVSDITDVGGNINGDGTGAFYVGNIYFYKGSKDVTIASSGWSSFSSAYALDFANAVDGGGNKTLKAYVLSDLTSTKATLTSVDQAPANTGLILKGTPGTTYSIPVIASASLVGTNNLTAAVNGATVGANSVYVVSGGQLKLYTGTKIPAGKAYLEATKVPAGSQFISLDDSGTTGISNIETQKESFDGEFYDLQGRKVAAPSKGLYIVNGKKVVVK